MTNNNFSSEVNEFFTHMMMCALYYEEHMRKNEPIAPRNSQKSRFDLADPHTTDEWLTRVFCDIAVVARHIANIDDKVALREAAALSRYLPNNLNIPPAYLPQFNSDLEKADLRYIADSLHFSKEPNKRLTLSFKILIDVHYDMFKNKTSASKTLQEELDMLKYIIGIMARILAYIAISDKKIYKDEINEISAFVKIFSNAVSKKFGVPFSVEVEMDSLIDFMLDSAKYKA